MNPPLATTRSRRRAAFVTAATAALVAVPAVASAPTATAATAPFSQAQQVVIMVNAQRAKVGCRPVQFNLALQRASLLHSADMAKRGYFSHTSLDGRTFVQRIRAQGYTGNRLGENIAAGYRTPSTVMAAWMKSPGHKANILNCGFTSIGVGIATGGPYGYYWTQDFGG